MKITKSQIQQIIREELKDLTEGYMDAYERAGREEKRQSSRDYDARERERERNQRSGNTGGGTRMGGSYKKERFAGFNRDDESSDEREGHNIDDLWAMVRNLRRELDDMRDKK